MKIPSKPSKYHLLLPTHNNQSKLLHNSVEQFYDKLGQFEIAKGQINVVCHGGKHMDHMVIIDFDGTISMEDISENVLIQFAVGDWKGVEDRANAGEISMNECMIQQYGMVRASMTQIMEEADKVALRDGVHDFFEFTEHNDIKVVCVSAGISFIIDHVFNKNDWNIDIIAPRAELTDEGISLELIDHDNTYLDFKDYQVQTWKDRGKKVIYIGDGFSDYGGIRLADLRYIVRGSSLSKKCKEDGLKHVEFSDFNELILDLQNYLFPLG